MLIIKKKTTTTQWELDELRGFNSRTQIENEHMVTCGAAEQ